MSGIISTGFYAFIFTLILFILASVFMGLKLFASSFFTPFAFLIIFCWVFWEIMLLKL